MLKLKDDAHCVARKQHIDIDCNNAFQRDNNQKLAYRDCSEVFYGTSISVTD